MITTARSYTHPSTSIPAVSSFVPSSFQSSSAHHLPPNLKLRLTIQIHLYYLLGLHSWSSNEKLKAESYWQEILRIADSTGGTVGTKEGDEIVFSAAQRLKSAKGEVSLDSKSRIKKSGSISISAVVIDENIEQDGEGDALQDIWREKLAGLALEKSMKELRKASISSKGKGKEIEGIESKLDSTRVSISAFNPFSSNTINPFSSNTTTTKPIIESTSPPIVTNSVKVAKFHFATTSDYPTPPETPNPSPPSSSRNGLEVDLNKLVRTSSVINFSKSNTGFEEQKQPVTLASLVQSSSTFPEELEEQIRPSFPRRRKTSCSSFQPSQLLPRVHSSASISTLPPDFFSTKTKIIPGSKVISGVGGSMSSSNSYLVKGSTSRMSNVTNIIEEESNSTGGKAWIKSRFLSLKSTINVFNRDKKITAISILENVLKKDDESAGPGMYWGSEADGGEDAVEILEGDSAMNDRIQQENRENISNSPVASTSSSKRSRSNLKELNGSNTPPIRPLQSQRSFIDVTSPRISSNPKVTYTPPTPRDYLELFPSPDNKLSLSTSSAINLSTSPTSSTIRKSKLKRFDSGIDPMLLELERASRVGVKTKCFTCGKKGLNYPATRDGTTYCTRECRMKK